DDAQLIELDRCPRFTATTKRVHEPGEAREAHRDTGNREEERLVAHGGEGKRSLHPSRTAASGSGGRPRRDADLAGIPAMIRISTRKPSRGTAACTVVRGGPSFGKCRRTRLLSRSTPSCGNGVGVSPIRTIRAGLLDSSLRDRGTADMIRGQALRKGV